MRPRHGAAAGGARARPGERRAPRARPGRRGGARAAPAAPGQRLRQDLRRLRPALLLLRHPADQGRLRDRGGRRGAARGAARRWPPAPASWCSSARTRRGGRSPAGAGSSRLLGELAALEPAPDWLRLLYLQPDGVDRRASGGPCGARRALRGRPPPARLRRRPAPHAALRRRRRAPGPARARPRARCPAPPCARRSSPGSPARPTPSSRSSSPSCATPGLAVAGVFVYDEQEGTAAAGMPGAVPAELAFERAARLGEVIDREAERFWSGLAGPGRRRPRRARHGAARRRRRGPHRAAGARRRRPDHADRRAVRAGATSCAPSCATASGMMWRPSPRQGDSEQPAQPRQQHHHRADPARSRVPGAAALGHPAALRRPRSRRPSSSSPPPPTSSTATSRGAASRSPRSASSSTRWPTSCSSPRRSSPSSRRTGSPPGSPWSSSAARSP